MTDRLTHAIQGTGLTVTVGLDGVWLNFRASTGKQVSIHLDDHRLNGLVPRGSIMRDALLDWHKDQLILRNEAASRSRKEATMANKTYDPAHTMTNEANWDDVMMAIMTAVAEGEGELRARYLQAAFAELGLRVIEVS